MSVARKKPHTHPVSQPAGQPTVVCVYVSTPSKRRTSYDNRPRPTVYLNVNILQHPENREYVSITLMDIDSHRTASETICGSSVRERAKGAVRGGETGNLSVESEIILTCGRATGVFRYEWEMLLCITHIVYWFPTADKSFQLDEK